jgi:hypothetical protein
MLLCEAHAAYIKITAGDSMIHKSVAQAVNGLREFLEVERKRIPGNILFEADRLECQLLAGYDPSFAGDEPPGLSSRVPVRPFRQRDFSTLRDYPFLIRPVSGHGIIHRRQTVSLRNY